MTKLHCSVDSCNYNNSNHCCISSINVDGEGASSPSATCCESFETKNSSFTNSCVVPNESLDIGCDAHNCVFNSGAKCSADEISIEGASANSSQDTLCGSFKSK